MVPVKDPAIPVVFTWRDVPELRFRVPGPLRPPIVSLKFTSTVPPELIVSALCGAKEAWSYVSWSVTLLTVVVPV